MEGIIFIGLQASGKSTFYRERFFDTHMRISMDLLNTRNKERQFIQACLKLQQRLVIDNTNPTVDERTRYIQDFKRYKFKAIGYYFRTNLEKSLHYNEKRMGKAKVNRFGILSTHKRLQLPSFEEGFDELYYVSIEDKKFCQGVLHKVCQQFWELRGDTFGPAPVEAGLGWSKRGGCPLGEGRHHRSSLRRSS